MARPYRRWTIKDLEFLRVMYVVMTRKAIAIELGVKERHVRDALRRYGISKPWKKKYKKWTDEDLHIIRMKYATTPSKVLAAELGISTSTLWGTVHRYGLIKRNRKCKTELIEQ